MSDENLSAETLRRQLRDQLLRVVIGVFTNQVVECLIAGDGEGAAQAMEEFHRELVQTLDAARGRGVTNAARPSAN